MRKLFQLLRAHVGQPITNGRERVTEEFRAALGTGGDEWFRWLDRQRNFVAHEGTTYLAIDVTNEVAPKLLVMKENPTHFADSRDFFRYAELVGVASGFNGARQALQEYLITLIRSVGTQPT